MLKQLALGLFCCIWGIANAAADSDTVVKNLSCSIELAMHASPHAYLVAMVQHPGKDHCGESGCTRTFPVLKVLAKGDGIGILPTSITISPTIPGRIPASSDDNNKTSDSEESKGIGVYIRAADGGLYRWLSETFSLYPEEVAQQAVAIAKAAPAVGVPDCRK